MAEQRSDPTLQDDIFAVAATVETEAPGAGPRLPLRLDHPPKLPSSRLMWPFGAGFATFFFVDVVMMWAPLMNASRPSLLPQMITLLVLAFGLGSLLVFRVGGAWRPFGVGMMASWVFLSLISVGFLTGFGPLVP
ncbi:hypothetical protein [Actinomadura flavalba]|uniref:hypothetical protein n=1 Tax=Actinomadura flavalba TaxID=1120938 RepID=UPI0003784266|nr:hypothetical protein [Actinomadura flavalba]